MKLDPAQNRPLMPLRLWNANTPGSPAVIVLQFSITYNKVEFLIINMQHDCICHLFRLPNANLNSHFSDLTEYLHASCPKPLHEEHCTAYIPSNHLAPTSVTIFPAGRLLCL